MSSNLVSYSSEEDEAEDGGKKQKDANYDDVGMDMSDEEEEDSSEGEKEQTATDRDRGLKCETEKRLFASNDDYLSFKEQFGSNKVAPPQKKTSTRTIGSDNEPKAVAASEYESTAAASEYGTPAAPPSSEYGSVEPPAGKSVSTASSEGRQEPENMDLVNEAEEEQEEKQRIEPTSSRVSAAVSDRLIRISREDGGGGSEGQNRPSKRDRYHHHHHHQRDRERDYDGGGRRERDRKERRRRRSRDGDRRRRSRDRGGRKERRSRSDSRSRSRSRSRDRGRRKHQHSGDHQASSGSQMGRNVTPGEETRTKSELRSRKLEAMGMTSAAGGDSGGGGGVEVPKYYNANAINPLKYADQMKKRQLVWGNKGRGAGDPLTSSATATPAMAFTAASSSSSTAEKKASSLPAGVIMPKPKIAPNSPFKQSFNKWEKTNFGDSSTNEKFRNVACMDAAHFHLTAFS